MRKFFNKSIMLIVGIAIILYFLLIHIFAYNVSTFTIIIISRIMIILSIVILFCNLIQEYINNKKIDYRKIIILIIVIGIILRTLYISYTTIQERQHDMYENIGHLSYIEEIYETGKLPETNRGQFYQQPLHHIISAAWLKINTLCGVDLLKAEEGIQVLTAIYSSLIMLVAYSILKELKIKDKYKILVLLMIAIHPTFIILSGSINNDILMIMFTFLIILYLIKWNKKASYKNTIILALFTACIALTKISGTIIAIPILYVFINKFIKEYIKSGSKKQVIKNYMIRFVVFGIIALGLGLSYSIRNMVLFGQSLFYVPNPGQLLFCGDSSWWERLNIFSRELLQNTYCNSLGDCNIPAYIIKSSLFGEYSLNEVMKAYIIPKLLIIINIILIAISLLSLISVMLRYKKIGKRFRVILNIFILTFFSLMFMYCYGNVVMPYGPTMDFRYIVPTIFTGMIFIIINMMTLEKNKRNMFISIAIYVVLITFSILSIIFEVTDMNWLILRYVVNG